MQRRIAGVIREIETRHDDEKSFTMLLAVCSKV